MGLVILSGDYEEESIEEENPTNEIPVHLYHLVMVDNHGSNVSMETTKKIMCDQCGLVYPDEFPGDEEINLTGWNKVGVMDYCPECSQFKRFD